MRRSQLTLVALAASRKLLSTSTTNGENKETSNAENIEKSSPQGPSAAEKNDAESSTVNLETEADSAFFRAQEQAKMRNPVDGPDYDQRIPSAGEEGYSRSLPTASKYRALSTEELIQMLKLRDKQIADIRLIYENFHNEVEKQYRKQIFDYHDKAITFSQTHGQMQSQSINHTREALVKLREQEELEHRDLKIVYTLCLISTIAFWLWVRRHYIAKADLEYATPTDAGEAPFTLRTAEMSLTPGLVNRLMGTGRETWFEKEKRLEREAIAKEAKEREEERKRMAEDPAYAAAVKEKKQKEEQQQQQQQQPVGEVVAAVTANKTISPEEEAREALRKQRAWR